ncbi:MAG TPA: endonuclease III [Candidatus Nitrosopolaris sp.]
MTLDYSIGTILEKMQAAVNNRKGINRTALRQLQIEEQGDAFKILIGTILSARTRDINTKKVISKLFNRFINVNELAEADLEEVKTIIRSTGFYNIKARRVIEVSKLIRDKFNGYVPNDVEILTSLPGVGRKTANCVLVYGFNKPAIPVDTHVHRISNRLGLVNTKNPERTESELEWKIEKRYWTKLNDTFVMYGQNICLPVKPQCELCGLTGICKYYNNSIAPSLKN